jgi:MFS family permease
MTLLTNSSVSTPLPTDSKHQLRRNLRAIMGDGASFSVMVGIGETYVPAFVLALGLGEVAAGLVATVPLLIGSLLQTVSPWGMRRLGTYRRWVVSCATCQALSLVAMSLIAWNSSWSGWWIFVAASLYWAAGLATGPAWSTWVEHLVPRSVRSSFFASRVRISQICTLVGLMAGGLLLRSGGTGDALRGMFAITFAAAAFARLLSAYLLSRQSETKPTWPTGNPMKFARPLPAGSALVQRGPGLRLVIYLMGVQVGVYLAGPYFTPFMLSKLELTYTQYTLLLSSAFLGKIVTLPWLGGYAKRAGATRLLWLGGVGIIPVSSLWLISDSFYYLLGMQFVAGMIWAAYELAVFLMFFETVPREQRVLVMTWYNVGNSAAMVGGALLGALAMSFLGDGVRAYLTLFVLSSVVRALALLLLPGVPERLRSAAPLAMRTLAVRPSAGTIAGPLLPSVPEETPVGARRRILPLWPLVARAAVVKMPAAVPTALSPATLGKPHRGNALAESPEAKHDETRGEPLSAELTAERPEPVYASNV